MRHTTACSESRAVALSRGARRLVVWALVAAISGIAAEGQEGCELGETPVAFPVGEITEYTVPAGLRSLRILAKGGKGGGAWSGPGGGKGAVLKGTVVLGEGEVLQVLVGTMGSVGSFDHNGGGGGGSFVGVGTNLSAFSASNLLVAAGGGGGEGTHPDFPWGGSGGLNGGDGGGGRGGRADGTGGDGGQFSGGGGGATTGDHGDDVQGGFGSGGGGGAGGKGGDAGGITGGQAAVDGGAGGDGDADGGFGGGGAPGFGAGGGGGYAGGSGGSFLQGGGGGSSFFAVEVSERWIEATNEGDGEVLFCEIPPPARILDVDPASLASTLESGETETQSLTAANLGYEALEWEVSEEDAVFQRIDATELAGGEDLLDSAVIDPAGEFAYLGTSTSPGQVVKIDLKTLQRVGAITLEVGVGEAFLSSAVIDPAGKFAYFGTGPVVPGRVVKIDLETFERIDAITLGSDEGHIYSAVIDPAGEFAYFGITAGFFGKVVKIKLDTFERIDTVTLESGEYRLWAAVIDPAGEFAYFGTSTAPGQVVKIDLQTFQRVDTITLEGGEDWLVSAVIDPAGEFAYFGTYTAPGRVVRIKLGNLSRVDAIEAESGDIGLASAVIDPAGDLAYFATDTAPGRVVGIDIEEFEQIGSITLPSGENELGSAVIDPAGRFAYFGTSNAPGRVVKVGLRGPDCTLPDWVSADPASGSIPGGGGQVVDVIFNATGQEPDLYEANLCLDSNDLLKPRTTVPLNLTVIEASQPELIFEPASLDFGDVEVGTESAPLSATLSNLGTAEATELDFSVPGEGFAVDASACGSGLPTSASCQVSVAFTPPVTGSFAATLQVTSEEDATAEAQLTGTGTMPGLSVTPAALDFGEVPVGDDSEPASVTLTNTGTADLTVSAVSGPGTPFAPAGGSCGDAPFTLAPAASCDLAFTFGPTVIGAAATAVTLGSNAPSSPHEVSLQGLGTAAVVAVEPDSMAFVLITGESETQSLTIDNLGNSDLDWIIELAGFEPVLVVPAANRLGELGPAAGTGPVECTDPTEISSIDVDPDFGTTPPSATSPVAVTVDTAELEVGDYLAHLCIASSDPGTPLVVVPVSLIVAVAPVPVLAFDPPSLDFGDVEIGSTEAMTATLRNTGTAAATTLELQLTGDGFDADWSACGTSLEPDASCLVGVAFTPEAAGTAAAAVAVHSDEGAAAELALAGVGVEPPAPELVFDPASLDFGDVEVGTVSDELTATLHNTGSAPATGIAFELSAGDFDVDIDDCGTILAEGASCTVHVAFAPSAKGPAGATLAVTSTEDAVAELSLTGNGVDETEVFSPVALEVDEEPGGLSDGNRVFEPAERVEVAPAWRNDGEIPRFLDGTASDFTGLAGPTYTLVFDEAGYGEVEPEAITSCRETGMCYEMEIGPVGAARPATHWDATFDETLSGETVKTWTLHVGDSFLDVPLTSPFYHSIESVLHHGVTGGCTSAKYCPAGANTRGQMAVFLLRALEGGGYTPPACVPDAELFIDVPFASPFCPWIEELAAREITSGCGGGRYCPGNSVTRAQMAIFLLKAFEGAGYTPPACTGAFTDVPCPSTFGAWIEELADRGVTSGCSAAPPTYCPASPVTRAQMAVFVTRAFGLALYGP